MTKNIALSRPAMSAIAAFLVLSTPGAFAQETPTVTMTPPVAAPTPQTPPTVAEPSMTAPVAAPQTAEPPAPKPVIRVPLDIAPAETAPAPKAAERAAPPARTERSAARARTAVAAPAAAPAAAAPVTEAVETEGFTPMAAPAVTPVEPVTPVTEPVPAPAEKAAATGGDFPWEIAGGAAALLIVGGAGLAFIRRRRVAGAAAEKMTTYAAERTAPAEPLADGAQPWVTPAYAPRQEPAARRSTPAFAAAPSGSMGRHEAMALAGPTPDNPFATLSKRLKRARFLDRQERTTYDEALASQKDMTRKPVSAWEIAQRPAPAAQEQEVRRPEPARVRTSTSFRPGFSKS